MSNGAQAAQVAAFADGVIVGSAFVRRLLDADGHRGGNERRHRPRRRAVRRSPPSPSQAGSAARRVISQGGARVDPEPSSAAWRLGPLPVRAYALCVTAGILVAVAVASRRYRRSGGRRGVMLDVAAWAVPFGLIGAAAHALLIATRHDFTHAYRLWHAVTLGVAAIGVPGAVALGAAGAWIACRRGRAPGLPLGPVAGAAAPAVMFGLAIGGLGNWWTQQFYGPPSTWWWAVQISPTHRAPGYENYDTFQPAFLYQSLWDVAVGLGVIWAARRFAAVRRAHVHAVRGLLRGGQLLGGIGAHRPAAAGAGRPLRRARRRRGLPPGRGWSIPDPAAAHPTSAYVGQVGTWDTGRRFSG